MGMLDNKVAVIVGGASGIGLAIAKRFVGEGATVYVTGRRAGDLAAAVEEIGAQARSLVADASVPEAIGAAMGQVQREQGRIDTLVVSAGLAEPASIDDIDETFFDRHVHLNLRGPVFALKTALPSMPAGASVVLVGSIASALGTPSYGVYNATKAGLRSFARTWTNELAGRGIRVNVVSPGPTATRMFLAETAPEVQAALTGKIPLGRPAHVDEVAAVALFLASDESSFVAGIELPVDGGMAQV